MLSRTIFAHLLFSFKFIHVLSQVCVHTKMIWRDVPETYMYTYLEAYEKPNCLFWCTDTRVASAVGTRTVRRQVAEQVNVCCDGYEEEEMHVGNSIHCKPLCTPLCVNGYCKSPDVCSCNPGYLPDHFEPHNCSPMCLKGCEHGTCTEPNNCECDRGYESIDEVCEPVCFEDCNNGACVAPNTCQCLPGYRKSDNGTCEPYCSSYTANGECVYSITCEPGWAKVIKDSLEICQPICTEPCVNGTCVAPDVCDCYNGYIKLSANTCEPFCSSGCPRGKCISPETCICDPGWYKKKSDGVCLAHCDTSCGNGICVAPNFCDCFSGYVFDESKIMEDHVESTLCVPICENCEESCFYLKECTCVSPLQMVYLSAEGGNCDCTDECADNEVKCERALCSMFTDAETMETAVDDIESTTDVTMQYETSTGNMEHDTTVYNNWNDVYELKMKKASWLNSKWFYGIGSVLLTSMLIVVIAAILKRKRSKSYGPNGYDDSSPANIVHYKQTTTT